MTITCTAKRERPSIVNGFNFSPSLQILLCWSIVKVYRTMGYNLCFCMSMCPYAQHTLASIQCSRSNSLSSIHMHSTRNCYRHECHQFSAYVHFVFFSCFLFVFVFRFVFFELVHRRLHHNFAFSILRTSLNTITWKCHFGYSRYNEHICYEQEQLHSLTPCSHCDVLWCDVAYVEYKSVGRCMRLHAYAWCVT